MKPVILDDSKTLTQLLNDKTNGLGRLSDCISCVVNEDLNGAYTATIEYPVTGVNYEKLHTDGLLLIQPNLYDSNQIFRIDSISKPIDEVVTLNCNHISYDLKKTSVLPFKANGATMGLIEMKANMVGCEEFEFSTDISDTSTEFGTKIPVSARSLLGGEQTSFLNTFGGEFEWDNLTVSIVKRRGNDSGVEIRYGVDLTDFKHDESIDAVYTHLMPYITYTRKIETTEGDKTTSTSEEVTLVGDLQEIVSVPSNKRRIINTDLSEYYQEWDIETQGEPTKADVNKTAQTYIKENNLNVPMVSMTVSFVPLWQTEQYKNVAPLKRVSLGDTVHVEYNRIGISAEARVNSYEWDVLAEMYNTLTLGDVQSTLSGTIAGIENDISKVNTSGGLSGTSQVQVDQIVQNAIEEATELITGAYGGYMIIGLNADGQPNELFFMDTNDKATAKKVLRLNMNGIGSSETGINGPYTASMTIGGKINASQITFGELDGNLIKANTIMAGALDKVLNNKINSNITDVSVQYASNQSQTTPPTDGWSENAPEWHEGHYIWQRTETILADGTTKYSDALCITGIKGDTGVGVTSITPQYYLSTSDTAQEGGSWSDTEQPYESGKYYWTRSKITWSDGTTTYTGAVLAEGINNANSVADAASTTAINASNTATDANNVAQNAQITASNAQSVASDAQETANDAYEQALAVQEIAKNAQDVADNATKLAQGALDGLSELNQAFFVDSTGAHVRDEAGGEAVIQGDGTHLLVNGKEVARFTANDTHVNNLAVSQFVMFGAHRIEEVNINNVQCTAFYWIGDVQ